MRFDRRESVFWNRNSQVGFEKSTAVKNDTVVDAQDLAFVARPSPAGTSLSILPFDIVTPSLTTVTALPVESQIADLLKYCSGHQVRDSRGLYASLRGISPAVHGELSQEVLLTFFRAVFMENHRGALITSVLR